MTDIFNLLFLISLKQLTGLHCTIPDACPDISPTTKVADMCSDNYAIEEIEDGSDARDSVVVRVMNQTDGCICHVTAEYQNDPTGLYIRKYKNFESAAPVHEKCGLEVNIAYEETMYSMTCTERQEVNSVPLLKGGILSLTSNVIDGTFTRGYCIEIMRARSSEQNLALRVVCGNPGILPSTLSPQPTTTTTTTITSSTLTPKDDSSTVQSDTTDDKTHYTVSQTNGTSQQTTQGEVNQAAQNIDQEQSVLYIAIGASAGFIVIFVIGIITVLYKRKKIKKKQESQHDDKSNDPPDNQDSDGLKYNVLYISSEQQDNLEVDYSTVDTDSLHEGRYNVVDNGNFSSSNDERQHSQKLSITRPKPSTRTNESSISLPDSSNGNELFTQTNNVYAVVNKKKKDSVNEVSSDTNSTVEQSKDKRSFRVWSK